MPVKEDWIIYINNLQNSICAEIEALDERAIFQEDQWLRPEGGGGKTRITANGNIFEKGGVNTSVVFGSVTDTMRLQLKMQGEKWFACGLSVVLHPLNPFVPAVHCNYRMLEIYDGNDLLIDRWFGGGTDLTPSYLFEGDARHFHEVYKLTCDRFDPVFYPVFKQNCDEYFTNAHRNNEMRGIGGIFYDYQRPTNKKPIEFWMNFSQACGDSFIDAYIPLVKKRMNTEFSPKNRHWQEIRRGRYTEFNLVYDRGTLFGLKTNGRTESILMSLPPTARFEYQFTPEAGSEEEKLLNACLHPKKWA